jgi:hypothetical protein
VVKHKCKPLSSNSSTTRKEKGKEGKEGGREEGRKEGKTARHGGAYL